MFCILFEVGKVALKILFIFCTCYTDPLVKYDNQIVIGNLRVQSRWKELSERNLGSKHRNTDYIALKNKFKAIFILYINYICLILQ